LVLNAAKGSCLALQDCMTTKEMAFREITRMSKDPHPAMLRHQRNTTAWRGQTNGPPRYVVLVHDTFTFEAGACD
jgi:hypothetical protein